MALIEIYRYKPYDGSELSPYVWNIWHGTVPSFDNARVVESRVYNYPVDNWYSQRGCVSQVGNLVERLNSGRLQFKDLPKELLN